MHHLNIRSLPKKKAQIMGIQDGNGYILNSDFCDKMYRFYLRKCGGSNKFKDQYAH